MSNAELTQLNFPTIPLDLIRPPGDPIRSTVDEDEFLALVESFREIGQITPIVVFKDGDEYEIIAGHRRFLAARHLKWPTIEVRVVERDETLNAAVKLHENAFREAVSPEDEGKYFDKLARDRGLSVRDLAKITGRSHYYIQSRLACTTYPPDIKDALREKKISLAVAEAFAKIDDGVERRRLLSYAMDAGCTAKTAQVWADSWRVTQTTVDNENLVAPPPPPNTTWAEAMFPCYLCSTPTPLTHLQILRLCGDCHADISTAKRNLASTNAHHQRLTEDEGRTGQTTQAPGPQEG